MNPVLALVVCLAAGMAAGAVTGILHTVFEIPAILAGILTQISLWSINQMCIRDRFSPIRPALSTHQNNRDHRKICVIDGHTAFTGGVNLADEYINRKVRCV